jgi:hypothetical protein
MRPIAALALVVATSLNLAYGATLTAAPDSRATEFVVNVATRDLHDARNGNEHVFSYNH